MQVPLRAAVPLIALLAALPAGADQVTISPTKDNTLYFSPSGTLSNGAGAFFFVGKDFNGDTKRAVLAFDIATNVPAQATIDSVKLTLNMSRTKPGGGSPPISMHRLTKDWGEGGSDAPVNEGQGTTAQIGDATWLHAFYNTVVWTSPGGDFQATPSAALVVSTIGPYTWGTTPQLVADVQMWLDNPATNFGWLMKNTELASTTAKRFDSKDNLNAANRPMLTIWYTPFNTPTIRSTWGSIKALYR